MEDNMRFGLILGRLEISKNKIRPIMSNFCYFLFKNIVASALKSCIMSLLKFLSEFFLFFLAKNRINIYNKLLCIALLETSPCATSL